MKKSFKFLICVLLTIIFVPNVMAFNTGDSFTIASSSGQSSGMGFPYSYQSHTASSGSGSFEAFCLDRGNGISTSDRYVVSRTMPTLKYDYAVLAIIKSDASYEAKHLAIRMLTDVMHGWANSNDEGYSNALRSAVQCFIDKDSQFAERYGQYGGRGTGVSCNNNYYSSLLSVKKVLSDALETAIEKMSDGAKRQTKVMKGPIGDVEKNGNMYSRVATISVSIYNIKNAADTVNEYFKYLGFTFQSENPGTKVTLLGASKTENTSKSGWTPISDGQDLSRLLDDRAAGGVIYVGFLIELESANEIDNGSEEDEQKCKVKITMNYEYTDQFVGAVLYPSDSQIGAKQRFVIAINDPIKDSFDLNTSLCDETMCDPVVEMPEICADGLEDRMDEDGNVEYKEREGFDSSGSKNIKKCILKSSDYAGNSYQLINESATRVQSNPYCAVYCKEDYAFVVPYKRYAESGRYFQISVKVRGQQDCYTTMFDYDKYVEDMQTLQIKLINAYNKWLQAKENIEQHDNGSWQRRDEVCEVCDGGLHAEMLEKRVVKHSNNFLEYVAEEGNEVVKIITPSPWPDDEYGEYSHDTDGRCDGGEICETIKTPEDEYQEKGWPSVKSENLEIIKQTIKDIKNTVDRYNSCDSAHVGTNGKKQYGDEGEPMWDMLYKYNPMIKYSYEEPEPLNRNVPKWINEVASQSCQDNTTYSGETCDVMVSVDEMVYNEPQCQEDDNYQFTGTKSITDIYGTTHPSTWYCDNDVTKDYDECKGNVTTVPEFWDRYHAMCTINGDDDIKCSNNEEDSYHKVTKIRNVHKIAASEGTYLTSRVYYSGHDDGDIKIEGTPAHVIDNYDLVDGLPVGINTPQGTYFYILDFGKIGSFYDEGKLKLGRLYDGTENSVINAYRGSSSTVNGDNVNSNQYACSYQVDQTTCTDSSGKIHYKTECTPNEKGYVDWEQCKKEICPQSNGPYCVSQAGGYYVCNNNYYDSSCIKKANREDALRSVGCNPNSGEVCEQNYNCCPECKVQCIGQCSIIHEAGGSNNAIPQLNFRTVSPGNLFTTERLIGYNWNPDPEVYNNSLVALKAKETIEEIEERANDLESGSTSEITPSDGKVRDYSLKVTMDTNMIGKIREYNKEAGSYNNDTLTCYDHIVEKYNGDAEACTKNGYTYDVRTDSPTVNKCIMKNIFCYSTFITDLLNGEYGGNASVSTTGRSENIEKLHETFTTIPLETNQGNKLVSDYWTIYQFTSIDTNGDGFPDIGPSWK